MPNLHLSATNMFRHYLLWAPILLICAWAPLHANPKSALSQKEMTILKRMGGTLTKDGKVKLGGVIIDIDSKEVSFPAKLNMTTGIVEVLICTPRGRTHESLLVADIDPFKLQTALALSGAKNGRLTTADDKTGGDRFHFEILPSRESGAAVESPNTSIPVEHLLLKEQTRESPEKTEWVFVGSSFTAQHGCLATIKGNLIDINSMDLDTILTYPFKISHQAVFFEINSKAVEKIATENGVKNATDLHVIVKLIPLRLKNK